MDDLLKNEGGVGLQEQAGSGPGPTQATKDAGAAAGAAKEAKPVTLTAKEEAILDRLYARLKDDANMRDMADDDAFDALSAHVKELTDTVTSLSAVVGGLLPPAIEASGAQPGVPMSIRATMVGGQFNCPECGLRISGTSMPVQGQGSVYEHSFDDSPRLSGAGRDPKCRLKGMKFRAPVIELQFVNPPTLTKATE